MRASDKSWNHIENGWCGCLRDLVSAFHVWENYIDRYVPTLKHDASEVALICSSDDDAAMNAASWTDIGRIEVLVRRAKEVMAGDHSGVFTGQAIHERSKKAGTHQVLCASLHLS